MLLTCASMDFTMIFRYQYQWVKINLMEEASRQSSNKFPPLYVYQVMNLMSLFGPLIYAGTYQSSLQRDFSVLERFNSICHVAEDSLHVNLTLWNLGCFAATLSSALSCLVSGSEMFQALCKDKVYPYMSRFGKGYGPKKDPYYSYAAGFVIALIFILIG